MTEHTSTTVAGYTLAVCAEMVFCDRPLIDRVSTIHDLGFAVEIWGWTTMDLAALAATGATFTSMTGYVNGDLLDPGGADELLRTAELSIAAAATLGQPNLNIHGTGLDGNGMPIKPIGHVTGTIGLEAWASGDDFAALEAFPAAFTT
jgi:hydroxypyruvate isomerase